eukprot:CAMPEP_0167751864 /NCGR_PEP_ID=MMETSP0110_2-20121227/6814_1 /TAXON_ID=629695 /ORGANISM="Gymnochlora sp., Strain CCMP2014" /LENGTH=2244 /DNA_ID=CAMNT_0007637405 /DNA_START=94 /DNA_END=6829 /DNA_ORIENTATION=-
MSDSESDLLSAMMVAPKSEPQPEPKAVKRKKKDLMRKNPTPFAMISERMSSTTGGLAPTPKELLKSLTKVKAESKRKKTRTPKKEESKDDVSSMVASPATPPLQVRSQQQVKQLQSLPTASPETSPSTINTTLQRRIIGTPPVSTSTATTSKRIGMPVSSSLSRRMPHASPVDSNSERTTRTIRSATNTSINTARPRIASIVPRTSTLSLLTEFSDDDTIIPPFVVSPSANSRNSNLDNLRLVSPSSRGSSRGRAKSRDIFGPRTESARVRSSSANPLNATTIDERDSLSGRESRSQSVAPQEEEKKSRISDLYVLPIPPEDGSKFQPSMANTRDLLERYEALLPMSEREVGGDINNMNKFKKQAFNIRVDFGSFVNPQGLVLEVYAGIYSGIEQAYITEEFFLAVDESGEPVKPGNGITPSCVFTDLTLKDVIKGELYLVVRAFRVGTFKTRGSTRSLIASSVRIVSQTQKQIVRRPAGVAVMELSYDACATIGKTAHSRRSKTIEEINLVTTKDEKDFPFLHTDMIRDSKTAVSTGISMELSLGLWRGDALPTVFRKTNVDYSSLAPTSRIVSPKSSTRQQRVATDPVVSPSHMRGFLQKLTQERLSRTGVGSISGALQRTSDLRGRTDSASPGHTRTGSTASTVSVTRIALSTTRIGIQYIKGVKSTTPKQKHKLRANETFMKARSVFSDSDHHLEVGEYAIPGTRGKSENTDFKTKIEDGDWMTSKKSPFHDSRANRISVVGRRDLSSYAPGSKANALCVTLERCEDEKGWASLGKWQKKKKSGKNILVRMQLRDNKRREPVDRCMSRGASLTSPCTQNYDTCVYYHNNTPIISERVLVHLPPNPDDYHLFLQFFHCPRDEPMYPIGYAFQRLSLDKKVKANLPVLKYSKKSGKSTETSNYLGFSQNLKNELHYGSFRLTVRLASDEVSPDRSVQKLLKFNHIARPFESKLITPKLIQHLQGKSTAAARWIHGMLYAVFKMLNSPRMQDLHEDIVLLLASFCSKDPSVDLNEAHIRKALGYKNHVTLSKDEGKLAHALAFGARIRYFIENDLRKANMPHAGIVILNVWERKLNDIMLPDDKRWADVLKLVRASPLLLSAALKSVDDEDQTDVIRSFEQVLIGSCNLLHKIVNSRRNFDGPLFHLIEKQLLTGIPKWIRLLRGTINQDAMNRVLQKLWIPLSSTIEKRSYMHESTISFLRSVRLLISVGIFNDIGSLRRRSIYLIPILQESVQSPSFEIKMICVEIVGALIGALGKEVPTEEQLEMKEKQAKSEIADLETMRESAQRNQDMVSALTCKIKAKEKAKIMNDYIKGSRELSQSRKKLIVSAITFLPAFNKIAISLHHGKYKLSENSGMSHKRACMLISATLCAIGHIAAIRTKNKEDSPLYAALATVKFSEGVSSWGGGKMELQYHLYNTIEGCLRIISKPSFEKKWIRMRLVEIQYAVNTLTHCRDYWKRYPNLIKSRFRKRFWELSWRALLATNADGDMNTSKQYHIICGDFLDRMCRRLVKNIQKTLLSLDSKSYARMGPDLVGPLLDFARNYRKAVSTLGVHMIFKLMHATWKTYQSLAHFENAVWTLVYDYVHTKFRPNIREISGRVDLRVEAPLLYSCQQIFSHKLQRLLTTRIRDTSVKAVEFVKMCDRFFIDVRAVFLHLYVTVAIETTSTSADRIADSLIHLLKFFKRTRHLKLFSIHALDLCNLHKKFGNELEYGHALQLHASDLGEGEDVLVALNTYPSETRTRRHWRLLKQAKAVFEVLQCFGKCAEISEELARLYKDKLYDIPALCAEHNLLAKYYNKILMIDAVYSKFYLVCFSSRGFSGDIQGRSFVYRSLKSLRGFTSEIKTTFPEAKISKTVSIEGDISKTPTISITTLTTSSIEKYEGKVGTWDITEMNERYKRFILNNNIKAFSFSRTHARDSPEVSEILDKRQHRAGVDGKLLTLPEEAGRPEEKEDKKDTNESGLISPRKFLAQKKKFGAGGKHKITPSMISKEINMRLSEQKRQEEKKEKEKHAKIWVIQTFVITEEPMPCARRRVRVISHKKKLLTPLQAALNTIRNKNDDISETSQQLVALSRKRQDTKGEVNRLSQRLNGTIDAAVNGGIKNYITAFFESNYIEENPEDTKTLIEFQFQLRRQIKLLDEGLVIFKEECGSQLMPLYEHLAKMHQKMSSEIRAALDKVAARTAARESRLGVSRATSPSSTMRPRPGSPSYVPSSSIRTRPGSPSSTAPSILTGQLSQTM